VFKKIIPIICLVLMLTGTAVYAQDHVKEIGMHVTVIEHPAALNVWSDPECTTPLVGINWGTRYLGDVQDFTFYLTNEGAEQEYTFDVLGTLPGTFTFCPPTVIVGLGVIPITMTITWDTVGQFDDFKIVIDEVN